MKKLGYVLAALGAIVIAAPSIASAETIVVKRGGYHHGYGARAEIVSTAIWHRHRGWESSPRPRRRDQAASLLRPKHAQTENGSSRSHFLCLRGRDSAPFEKSQ